jgi:HD-like signal output (HDOD) protein
MLLAQRNPNYGRGTHTLSDAAEPDRDSLVEWLETFLEKGSPVLPRPPTVALEIHELSRRADTSIEHIARLLGREPVLAARVLKLANSPMYRGEMPSATLKQALTRVGLAAARDIVMEAAMKMTVIRAEGMNKTLEQVRRHSTAVAWVSRAVARNTPLEAENAFLVGLLHDLGMSIGLIGLSEFLKAAKMPVQLSAAWWLVVDQLHLTLGRKVLERWQVGPAIAITVGNHHNLMVGGHPHPSVAVLLIAENLASDHGWDIQPMTEGEDDIAFVHGAEKVSADETDRALSALDLTRKHYEQLRADTAPMLATLAGQFND